MKKMNGLTKKLWYGAGLLLLVLILFRPMNVSADTTINIVDDCEADPTGTSDSTGKFVEALWTANTTDGMLTVIVPEGDYLISGNLFIYSDTHLILDENARIFTDNSHAGSILKGAHLVDGEIERCRKEDPQYKNDDSYVCNHGGYSQAHNIVIEGGTWEGPTDSSVDSQAILFRHASDITLKNMTIKGFTNHFVNISGSQNILVENVTFKDSVKYTGDSPDFWADYSNTDVTRFKWLEELHFDFTSQAAEGAARPQDNTPPKNIEVSNCTFTNVYSGIGTHHLNPIPAENIRIHDCSFTNLKSGDTAVEYGNAVNFRSVNGLTIANCTVNNCGSVTELQQVSNMMITGINRNDQNAGTFKDCGIAVYDTAGTIEGNTIRNVTTDKKDGILVQRNCDVTLRNNIITNCEHHGINIEGSAAVLEGNTVSQAKQSGIRVAKRTHDGTTWTSNVTLGAGNTMTNVATGTVTSGTIYAFSIVEGSVVSGVCPNITNSGGGGIRIENSTAHLSGGTIKTVSNIGIYVNEGKGGTVIDDISLSAVSGDYNIYVKNSSELVTVRKCELTSPAKYGIFNNASKVNAEDNEIINPTNNGIHFKEAKSGSALTKNKVINSKSRGIYLGNCAQITVFSNTITNSINDGIMAENTNSQTGPITISKNEIIKSGRYGIITLDIKATIQENTISNPTNNGIHLKNPKDGTVVLKNKITTSGNDGVLAENAGAATGLLTIDDNEINTTARYGVLVSGVKVGITKNRISNASNNGIHLKATKSGTTVKQNKVIKSKARGIYLDNCEYITLSGNTVESSTNDGVLAENGGPITINGNNEIKDPGRFGIAVIGAKGTVTGNTVTNAGDNGIHANKVKSGTLIKQNTVSGAKNRGIFVGGNSASTTVSDNTITNSVQHGIFAYQSVVKVEGNLSDSASTKADSKDISMLECKSGSSLKNNRYGTRGFLVKDSKATGGGNTSIYLKIKAIPNQTYTGSAITPTPVATIEGHGVVISMGTAATNLKKGRDYILSYTNNVNVGTKTATVKLTDPAPFQNGGGYSPYYPITGSQTFSIVKGSATPTPSAPTWKRLAGTDALGTMEKITTEFGIATTAVIATNENFRDSLAAAGLAGSLKAPMMTTKKSALANETKRELNRMKVTKVYLVGATSDISETVVNQIKSQTGVKTVVRVSATSVSAKAVACANAQPSRSKTVIIATQASFKDALSISPYAYAAKSPILYAESNKSLSAATLAHIKGKYNKAIIVGGPNALPSSIETQLKNSAGISSGNITRLAGSTQYDTSRIIAEWAVGTLKKGSGGGSGYYKYASIKFEPEVLMSANKLGIARGDGASNAWKDALAGAALCGKNKAVLLLADDKEGDKTAAAKTFIAKNKANIKMGYAFGGTAAVSKAVLDKMIAASK